MSKPDLDLEDLLVPGEFGFDDAPGELLVPSSGPELLLRKKAALGLLRKKAVLGLSQHHAEHLVGYGFIAPEGDPGGRWTMSPAEPFRATRIYAWSETESFIESLEFEDDEQLLEDSSLSSELFRCWASLEQFLALYAGLEAAVPGFHRVLLKHLPAQPNFPVPLDLPTLSIGQWLSVRWKGSLTGLFICGRELMPQQRAEGTPGQPGQPGGKDPDPDLPSPPSSLPAFPPRAATKDPTP